MAHCYMLITILVWCFEVFVFHKFLGQISSQNMLFSVFTEICVFLIGIHSMQDWAWSYKKKENKKIKAYRKSLYKEPTVNRCLLILALKPLWSQVKRKAFHRQSTLESSCVRKETVDIDNVVTSRNGDRKIMQSIRKTSSSPTRKRKCNQLSQFWRTSIKVITIEKT